MSDHGADISLRVLRTRKSEVIPDVSDVLVRNVAEDAEHLSILRQLDTKWLIVVPLRTRQRAIGAMLLANSESCGTHRPKQGDAGAPEQQADPSPFDGLRHRNAFVDDVSRRRRGGDVSHVSP